MRNPDRIPVIMALITDIWVRPNFNDLRFNQLVNHLQHEYSSRNGGAGRTQLFEKEEKKYYTIYREYNIIDIFSLEDGAFEKFLLDYILDLDKPNE